VLEKFQAMGIELPEDIFRERVWKDE